MSQSLRCHEPKHSRPPCPSPTPKASSNSCPLGQWCHPIISSSVVPFSSCLQSFPESGSFPMTQFLASGGQSAKSLQSCLTLFDLRTVVSQACLSVGFSRHEYWSGLLCSPTRIFLIWQHNISYYDKNSIPWSVIGLFWVKMWNK